MADYRYPGPICSTQSPTAIDDGTMKRATSSRPGSIGLEIWIDSSSTEKLIEAARRATGHLPEHMRAEFAAHISPEAIATAVTILGIVAGSHAVGVGAVVDGLLIVAGAGLLGWQAIDVARDLIAYFEIAQSARDASDLDRAARHLARAISVIGVAVFVAFVSKKAAKKRKSSAGRAKPSMVVNEALVNLLLERILGSSKNVGTLTRENVKKAITFFHGAERPMSADDMVKALRGMDLHKPVAIFDLDAGTVLVQNIERSADGTARVGQWFTRSGTSIDQIGLARGNREYKLFKTTRPVQVLKSRAAAINDTWTQGRNATGYAPDKTGFQKLKAAEMTHGGGEQYFMLREEGGQMPVQAVESSVQ